MICRLDECANNTRTHHFLLLSLLGPESLQNFIDACLGRTDYYVGADSFLGLRTVQTMDGMYRSDASRKVEDVMYRE